MTTHTPHPRALAAWCAAAVVSALVTTNPLHRAMVLLVGINVCIALRRSDARLRPIALALACATVFGVVLNALMSHTGDHVLAVIPAAVPGVHGAITVEAVIYGLAISIGIAAATMAVMPLVVTLPADDLIDALPRHLERTGAAVGTAVNLVPRMVRTVGDIRDTTRVRGWHTQRRMPTRRILVPAFLLAVEDSVQLAEAMEARGFGAEGRTHWPARHWNGADMFAVAAAAAAVVVEVIARGNGGLADWYPFPSLTAPATSVATLMTAVLLLTPLAAWRAP